MSVALIDHVGGKPMSRAQRRAVVLHAAGHVCVICGGEATEVDHIHPRSCGGSDDLRNLQAACTSCNRRKGERLMWEAPQFYAHLTLGQLQYLVKHELERARNEMTTDLEWWGDACRVRQVVDLMARLVAAA